MRRAMPSGMLARELLTTVARPRALVIKTVVPLALALPLLLARAPTFWTAMLLTVLVAMTGAVGSAVTIARSRDSGFLGRLALTPRTPARVVVAWVAGAVTVDALQLAPAAVCVLALAPVTPTAALALVCIALATLCVANALGCVASVLAGGPGEVLLDVVVLLAPVLFLAGLFSDVPASGWRSVAAQVDPFAYAHAAFIAALGGVPRFGEREIVLAAAASAAASLLVLAALARPLLRRR
jgi:ABC-2 type transport system permease protein